MLKEEELPKVTIGVAVPIEILTELDELSRTQQYRSRSAVCRAFIEEGLRRRRKGKDLPKADQQTVQ